MVHISGWIVYNQSLELIVSRKEINKMYQCPQCKSMSLDPECEWCGPMPEEEKPKNMDELREIYGWEKPANQEINEDT